MGGVLVMVLALLGCYLIGSFPTGYLLVRWLKRLDVRATGSGNVGATNVARVAGTKTGAVVLLIDIAKGLLAAAVVAPWLLDDPSPTAILGCGLAAIIGHDFPIWLGFRGGKGVATTIGVLLVTMPVVAAVGLSAWTVCFLIWRYVSVASLALAASIPLGQLAMRHGLAQILLGAAVALLLVGKHRANIARLVQGLEGRFGQSR
jgi:glycerol-3-phosphate acyltransferase PlsY